MFVPIDEQNSIAKSELAAADVHVGGKQSSGGRWKRLFQRRRTQLFFALVFFS